MAQTDFDLAEAVSILWKIGAGIALVMGFGALVDPADASLEVASSERRYLRDSTSRAVTVLVRMTARNGNVWLHGCPRAPVVFLERDTDEGWRGEQQKNHYCSGDDKPGQPVRVLEGHTATTLLTISKAGRYHVAVPWGDWQWSRPFTVE